MKIQNYLLAFLFQIIFCLEPEDDVSDTNYIVFSNENVKVSNDIQIADTVVLIEKPGNYYITGESDEGNVVVKSNKVTLYLQNLKLMSAKTAPIIIAKNLKDVSIINIENTTLINFENPSTTEGECAVIKIKKNSVVHFKNNAIMTLFGVCNNIIKGGEKVSLYFDKCDGEYIINSNKTSISADNLLVFNGGVFTIQSSYGNGIKSVPDDSDNESIGKIVINDGDFKVQSYKDAFVAKKNITILNGKFDVMTQNGYNDPLYNVNVSSKGFKVTNDSKDSEIRIYSGDFEINTVDDAFRSNRDLTILGGNIQIRAGDDAICAKNDLVLGVKNAPLDDLKINIIYSYEALEGMTIKIYSGRIRAKASNDGINASGPVRHVEPVWNFTNRNFSNWNFTNRNNTSRNNTSRNNSNWWDNFNFWNNSDFDNTDWWNSFRNNNSSRNNTNQRRRYYFFGNDSYYISIFGGELYVDSDTDGFDSNGNVYIHGGNINIFSSPNGTDNPIDRDGNCTVFNAEVLAVGVKGAGYVHKWIDKGNQLYCFYTGKVSQNQKLEITNDKNKVIKEEVIPKNISYIFYTSLKLNKNYHFYIYTDKDKKQELNVTCDYLEQGEDDEDVNFSTDKNEENPKEGDNKEEDNKKKEDNKKEDNKNEDGNTKDTNEDKNTNNNSRYLGLFYSIYIIMLTILL